MNTLNAYNAKPDGYYMKMRANDPFLGFNSFNDDDDDLFIDRGVIRTKPVKLYNLPDWIKAKIFPPSHSVTSKPESAIPIEILFSAYSASFGWKITSISLSKSIK